MQFTAPVEVPVVAPANSPQPGAPKRTSLPSMLPPDWVIDSDWSTPAVVSVGLPFCSANIANALNTTRIAAITASSTRAWLLSLTRRPKATTNENGISSSAQISRMLVIPFGFSNGCAELALKKPAAVRAELLDRLLRGDRPAGDRLFGDRRGRVAGIERRLVDRDGDHAVAEVLDRRPARSARRRTRG